MREYEYLYGKIRHELRMPNYPYDNAGNCIWCNKSVTSHDSGWVATGGPVALRTVRKFHLSCFYKHTIGARNDRTKKSDRKNKLF